MTLTNGKYMMSQMSTLVHMYPVLTLMKSIQSNVTVKILQCHLA